MSKKLGVLVAILLGVASTAAMASESLRSGSTLVNLTVTKQLAACYQTTRVCYSTNRGRRCKPYRRRVICQHRSGSSIKRGGNYIRKKYGNGGRYYRRSNGGSGRRG